MELQHEFEVPVGIEDAFAVLTDIERVAPCMPGATLDEVDGDQFHGTVKVKVGPIRITYRGTATFVELDADAHAATIEARGRETRGAGTADAMIRATLQPVGADRTRVQVRTDLAVTGKPAQFGRGVLVDVGDKLLGQFAEALAAEVAGTGTPPASVHQASEPTDASEQPAPEEPAAPAAPEATRPVTASARRSDDTIDLLDAAGAPVVRRLAPVIALVAAGALLLWWRARHRT